MRPSRTRSDSGWIVVLAVGVAAVLWPHAPRAQEYQLGPRILYPANRNAGVHSDVPLIMRDAIQNIVLGTRLLATKPRIMGGEPAPEGAWPWAASLELKLRSRREAHFCGGAFIAPQWVITAAHCVTAGSGNAIDVLGGTNTLETGGVLYPVDRVVVNEKYDTQTQDYDVALLHLGKTYPGKTVRLLTAANARYATVGAYAVATGWGLTGEGTEVSNILRQVTVQIVSNAACNGLAAYSGAITDRMLCAGFPEGGKDSCQGDSGGPLMVADGKGGYFQAGVVSWGEGCGRPNKFGVYTRVSTIADWVAEKTGIRVGAKIGAKIGTKAAPAASKAGKAPARTAEPAPAKTAPAKTAPSTRATVATKPANAEAANAGIVRMRPPPARFGEASTSSAARARHTVSPQAATPPVAVPLPRPRPSTRARVRRGSRARSPRAPPRRYYYRGHVYYALPNERRHRTAPFE